MSAPDDAAPPAVTLDRVGPGGGVAADSAFGVALVSLWQQAAEDGAPVGLPVSVVRSEVAARVAPLVDGLRTGRVLGVAANRARPPAGRGRVAPAGRGNAVHTGRVELLLVDSAHAGTGIGTVLVNRLLVSARDRGPQGGRWRCRAVPGWRRSSPGSVPTPPPRRYIFYSQRGPI